MAKMNKLSLNVKKTKAMLFHMPQKKIIVPKIKINGTIIEFVDNFNCLGINLNEIKLYYKLINKQLPQYFNYFTCEANSDIHGYNTRSRNKLHIPKTNHNFAQNNLRYRIIQTVNKLPDNVIRKMYTHSIYGLTSYAKTYFISNYKTECTIENSYTYQCSMR